MSDQVPQESNTKFDFSSNPGISGLVKSIQGDDIGGGNSSMNVVNNAQNYIIGVRANQALNHTPSGSPVNVPAGALTALLTLSVPWPGLWIFTGNTNSNSLVGTTIARVVIDINGGGDIGEDTHESAIGATLSTIGHSVTSYPIVCAGGETITLSMQQDSAGSLDINAVLNGVRLGT
jgi:hypothetical protein